MDDALPAPARHKLDVDAYHRMGEAGIFGSNKRIELIEGEIIDMAPIGADHASAVNGLTRLLVIACGDRAVVAPQNPVHLDRLSELQPDFALLRPRDDLYSTAHPTASDILLLIEVSDSSLRFDRAVKLPLYARMGVPEVWIVDLRRRAIDVFRMPIGDEYTSRQALNEGDIITLAEDPAITLKLNGIFNRS